MDTERLKRWIRAAVLAAPISGCAGAPPPPPEEPPAPSAAVEPPESPPGEAQPEQTEASAPQAQPGDGTMSAEEFDRRWRESLRRPSPDVGVRIIDGRPLASGAQPSIRARAVTAAGWSVEPPSIAAPAAIEARVQARWIDAALAEHASVASFARAAMELLAVGAPAELVRDHLAAAQDEVTHATVSFSLARAYGARATAPGPLAAPAPRAASIARLAADTFVEGCVNETAAALVARRAASGCSIGAVRDALARIADDEERHAALAWRTVRWAASVDPAAARAVCSIPLCAPVPRVADPDREALAAHGLLDDAALARCMDDAITRVVTPLRDELLA